MATFQRLYGQEKAVLAIDLVLTVSLCTGVDTAPPDLTLPHCHSAPLRGGGSGGSL